MQTQPSLDTTKLIYWTLRAVSSLVSHSNLPLHILTFLEKTLALQEPVNQDLLTNMRSTGGNTLKTTQRPRQENNAIPRVAPKWLKHDRQVSYVSRIT